MKYRINQGENSCDGSPIFRVYRVEGDTQIYCTAEGTIEKARQAVKRLMNPKPEVMVEEFES
jgi:hypothetical protein